MRKYLVSALLSLLFFLASCGGGRIFGPSPLKIAATFDAAGNTDEAVSVLKNAALEPGIKAPARREILMALAELYARRKDNLDAIQTLREASQLGKGDPFIRLRLGELLLEEGLVEKALAEFAVLDAAGVKTPSLLLGMGKAYHRSGRILKASLYLEKYLKNYPDDKKALMMLHESYEALGNYPASRNALAAVAGELSEKDFAVKMAVNWMRDGNPDEAAEELEKLVNSYQELEFYMGLAHYQKGELEKALELFSKRADNDDEASFFRALALVELGREGEAAPIFERLSGKERYARYSSVFLR